MCNFFLMYFMFVLYIVYMYMLYISIYYVFYSFGLKYRIVIYKSKFKFLLGY